MYENIKKIYKSMRLDYFVMAITYLMDIGYRNAKEITDEEIQNAEGNFLMTKDFCQFLMKTARQIATECEITDVYQLCQVEDVFAIPEGEGLSRERLETIVHYFIEFDNRSLSDIVADRDLEPEDLQALKYWTEEDVEKYYEEAE